MQGQFCVFRLKFSCIFYLLVTCYVPSTYMRWKVQVVNFLSAFFSPFSYYLFPFVPRTLFSTVFSRVMKALPNYNYENFKRRKTTFWKSMFLDGNIYSYMCKHLGSSPVRWRISDVFLHISLLHSIEYEVRSVFSTPYCRDVTYKCRLYYGPTEKQRSSCANRNTCVFKTIKYILIKSIVKCTHAP
jgi:hypothetical protein